MAVTNGALQPLSWWRRRRSSELRNERGNEAEPRVKYRGLDAFRLFAFLAVFLYHVSLLTSGYLGVQAFFVLSGFLITPILVDMRRQLPPGRYFLNFYGRRSLRIFPLYYAYLGAVGGITALTFATDRIPRPEALERVADQLVYALTYTYDFFHASRAFRQSSLLTHFWSLAVEEQFYLVWPFIVFFATGARLKRVLLAMLVAGPVIRAVEALVVSSPMGTFFTGRPDLVVYVLPFSHVDAFAMGGYLALCGRTPPGKVVGVYAAVLILVGIVTEWFATGVTGMTLGYNAFMADSWKYVWGYTCFNLLFGWILLMIRDRALVPALVEHPALVYLGQISYGLYVYHFGVIWVVSSIVGADFHGLPLLWRAIYAAAVFIVTVLISMTSYAVLEAPCLRLKDKYFPVARGRSVAAAPQLV